MFFLTPSGIAPGNSLGVLQGFPSEIPSGIPGVSSMNHQEKFPGFLQNFSQGFNLGILFLEFFRFLLDFSNMYLFIYLVYEQ